MSDSSITITIKLFAAYQEAYNLPELQLNFPSQTTVGEILDYVLAQKPQLEKWRDVTRFGVNLQFAEANTILNDGDEIVFIPPVSGG
ncbi:MAG: molybdopterin converting factor subunit 1 [Xenococcaceae cyanobacterium MO_234.B1]|nr:molybdopterin converting factor subunit 1 [Xenococcaceae cyanobacterium MO_234.B1]